MQEATTTTTTTTTTKFTTTTATATATATATTTSSTTTTTTTTATATATATARAAHATPSCLSRCVLFVAAPDLRGKLCCGVVAFRCAHGGKGFQDDDLRCLFPAGSRP